MKAQVYKVNSLWIVASSAFEAVNKFLEEKSFPLDLVSNSLNQGSTEEVTLTLNIHCLTDKEMDEPIIQCCSEDSDGCDLCSERNEPVLVSIRHFLSQHKDTPKPFVVAFEY